MTGDEDNQIHQFRIRDYATLEQIDQLHRNVEDVKKNLSEDTDFMTAEMSALIAKVDDAIQNMGQNSNTQSRQVIPEMKESLESRLANSITATCIPKQIPR